MQNIRLQTGPGTRGDTCDICLEVIELSCNTVTHTSCANTFHKVCMDSWVDSNLGNETEITCPKCRGTLNALSSPLNLELGSAANGRAVAERWLSTIPVEMYDYDMRAGFPTPAFVHFMDKHEDRAVDWMSNYFNRLCRAQNLSHEECVHRVRECFDHMSHADRLDDSLLIETELRAADAVLVTDLETVDEFMIRRPRPSVVDRFEENPRRAREWLRYRMARTQTDLGLDRDEMARTRSAFLKTVSNEIRRRQRYGR